MREIKQSDEITGTRKAVLDAACRVFARHPYNAASIRMIAREGGFGHAVIGYYYPTKAELFQAVADLLYTDLVSTNSRWLDEVRGMELQPGFSRYVSRVIEYSRKKPWLFRVMTLNISGEKVGDIPGKERLIETIERMRRVFADTMHLPPTREVSQFSESFNAVTLYYLGARDSAAWLLRMDPENDSYYQWVHDAMISIFLPRLDLLFKQKEAEKGNPGKKTAPAPGRESGADRN